jgi:hypothetical protein
MKLLFIIFHLLIIINVSAQDDGNGNAGKPIIPALKRLYIDTNFSISSLVPLGILYFSIDFYDVKFLDNRSEVNLKGKFCFHNSSPDCFGLSWVFLFLADRKGENLVNRSVIVNNSTKQEIENGLFDVTIRIKGNKKLIFYMRDFLSFQLDLKDFKRMKS